MNESAGRRRWTRLIGVAVAVLAVLSATGIALAYWTASGTGTGTATTGRAAAVSLTPGTPLATLYPGGAAGVTLTVANPNHTAVTIGSFVLDLTQGNGGFAVDAAHPACDTSALGFATQTNAAAGWRVPARTGAVDGALAISLPSALAMSTDAENACQGALFLVYLTAVS
jgi:hypothetical protein